MERSGREIAAAWQNLCAMLLVETCKTLGRRYIRRKDQIKDKRVAREWLKGGDAAVTFSDMCDSMGIDEARTRNAIGSYADCPGKSAISKAVFGVLTHAN